MSAQLDLCNFRGRALHSYPFAQMICVELQSALFNQGPALDLCNGRGPAFIFMLLNYVAPAGWLLHVSVVQCRGLQQRRALVQPKPFIQTCSLVIGWFESRLGGMTNISHSFHKCNTKDEMLQESEILSSVNLWIVGSLFLPGYVALNCKQCQHFHKGSQYVSITSTTAYIALVFSKLYCHCRCLCYCLFFWPGYVTSDQISQVKISKTCRRILIMYESAL